MFSYLDFRCYFEANGPSVKRTSTFEIYRLKHFLTSDEGSLTRMNFFPFLINSKVIAFIKVKVLVKSYQTVKFSVKRCLFVKYSVKEVFASLRKDLVYEVTNHLF